MRNTNIFAHASKELSLDAFLTWLFYYLDTEEQEKNKQTFFDNLLLYKTDSGKSVKNIEVKKQAKAGKKRVDILLKFELDGNKQQILFENKTRTRTSLTQLNNYKKSYPDCYRYFYLKLSYIDIKDEKDCQDCGYDVITSQDLLNALDKLEIKHPFFSDFKELIEEKYLNAIKEVRRKIAENDFSVFKRETGRNLFFSELYKNFIQKGFTKIRFSSENGRSDTWTHLDLPSKNIPVVTEKGTQNKHEGIYLKSDIRKDSDKKRKFCLRLMQYSSLGKNSAANERIADLRQIARNLQEKYPELKSGKLSNQGEKSREIAVFFGDKNNLSVLLDKLPDYSLEFIEKREQSDTSYLST